MEKLNFDEIMTIIKDDVMSEYEYGPDRWMYQDIDPNWKSDHHYTQEDDSKFIELMEKLGTFKLVEEYGGSDMGSTYYAIWYFEDHDVYIHFDGWYQSYNGADFSEAFEVFPREVTEIKYFRERAN